MTPSGDVRSYFWVIAKADTREGQVNSIWLIGSFTFDFSFKPAVFPELSYIYIESMQPLNVMYKMAHYDVVA